MPYFTKLPEKSIGTFFQAALKYQSSLEMHGIGDKINIFAENPQ